MFSFIFVSSSVIIHSSETEDSVAAVLLHISNETHFSLSYAHFFPIENNLIAAFGEIYDCG